MLLGYAGLVCKLIRNVEMLVFAFYDRADKHTNPFLTL